MRPPLQAVAPSIDDPIELLLACHGKVRRFAALALRLRDHLATTGPDTGPDAQAREAAQAILRYFNIAAPLHHDDEELDLFPALRRLGQPDLNAGMDALEAEHAELATLWASLGPWLNAIAEGHAHATPESVDAFAARYVAHAQREEDEIYPGAVHLTPDQVGRISAAMVQRRTPP